MAESESQKPPFSNDSGKRSDTGVATPAQKPSKIVWCGTRAAGTGQLEPGGARANHHGLVVEFVLEELLPLPPLEPFCELGC